MVDAPTTKERLLAEARDLYLEVGPPRFSLREVARRTGLTAAAVYRHFDGKEALLSAVYEEGFRVFGSYLMRALAHPTPMERLRAAGSEYLRFGLDRPRDYRVIFLRDHVEICVTQSPAPTFQFLVDRVGECMQAGVLRSGDAREVAVSIWAHVHGLVSLWIAGHLGPVGDETMFRALFTRSVDELLRGLAV